MGLTTMQISRLLAGKEKNGSKWCDASGVIHFGKPPAELIGSFHGRVGSVRRSSKGRSVRQPDGSRKYLAGNNLTETVAWYSIKR